MRRRSSFLVLFAGMLALLGSSVAVAAPQGGAHERVIVVLNDGTDARQAARDAARDHGAEVTFVYEYALKGFAATVPAGRVNALRNDARVDHVEHDRVMHAVGLVGDALPTGIDRVDAEANGNLGIDGNDDARVDARVAVIDTGVDFDHGDLNVNTALSVNCLHTTGGGPPWARDYQCVTGEGDDDNGHGTHVAGTIGALDDGPNVDGIHVVGVAPGVEIIAVKVLDSSGSGYTSGIVAGIDYVTSLNHDGPTDNDVDVANMSLGGSGSPGAMEDAIGRSVAAGVNYALAAGNSSKDVTGYTPAGQKDAITVSALADYDGKTGSASQSTCNNHGTDDTFASFSNYGKTTGDRVDIIAPGVCILSTVPGGGYNGTYSGTSMAAPHVAGAAALLAASGVAPANIKSTLITAADGVWVSASDPDKDPDPLLDVSDAGLFKPAMVSTSGDALPTVTVTAPTDGAEVSGTSVTITADATDDVGVDQVEFFVGSNSIGTGTYGVDGWTATWNLTDVADGTYTITAEATDTANQTASHSISVTVDNVDDAPSVAITAPTGGDTVSGTVTVTADATDDNGVDQVEFFVNGNSIATDTDGSNGWAAPWDTTVHLDGSTHDVTAIATDSGGNTAPSAVVSVIVDNSAPAAPDAGVGYDSWGGGTSDKHLGITVTLTDDSAPVGGASVSIRLTNDAGGSWTGTATTTSDGTVRWELKNAPRGCYRTDVTEIVVDGTTFTDPAEDDQGRCL